MNQRHLPDQCGLLFRPLPDFRHAGVGVKRCCNTTSRLDGSKDQAVLKRYRLIPSFLILDSSVCLGMPSLAAAPLGPDTGVARFLAQRGPGLHHVAYRVDDIEATLASLSAAGVRLIDERPRTGIRGSRVAFLHPAATGGVLTEIVEPANHQ